MKLVVFGATRGVGRNFMKQTLDAGHNITAVVREPSKLELKHNNLQVAKGDVMDFASVEQVIKDHEAVISSIGSPPLKNDKVRSEGTQNIIRAMEKNNIRRLISVSSLGVGDSKVMLPFLLKYFIVPFFLKNAFADHEIQENYIRQSNLDWTIIRPASLTNGGRTEVYRHGFPVTEKGLKLKISRADVADFMLKQLNDNTSIHKTPGISY